MRQANLQNSVVFVKRQGEKNGKRVVLDLISERLYRESAKFGFDTPDDAAEALLRYRGRIVALIDRHIDSGHSFDAYIDTSLRYMARTMRRERQKAADREFVCECAEVWSHGGVTNPAIPGIPSRASEPETTVLSAQPNQATPFPVTGGKILAGAGTNGRRLVYLFLKCVWEADESLMPRIASEAKVPEAWLAEAAHHARMYLEEERLRFEKIAEKRNLSWGRIYALEYRLKDEPEPSRRSALSLRLEKEKARNARIRTRVSRFNPTIPNSVLARILGIPKGTIDSGLYYMRKSLLLRAGKPAL